MGVGVDLRLLGYFVALAEERNFTAAARRLHLSQPALSQQIRLLERRLSATLVDRTSQPLRLTTAGAELLAGAQRLLAQAAELDASVRSVAAGRAGMLRVGVTWGGLYDMVMPALRELGARHPGVTVSVRQVGGLEQLASVRRDEVDVALHRVTHPEEFGALARRVLFDDPLLALLPAGHPAGRTGEVRLAELAGERFAMIGRSSKPVVFDRSLDLCRRAGFTPEVVCEVTDPMALALAVAAQGLVSLSGAGMSNRYPGVDYLPVTPRTGIAEVSAVWSPNCTNPLVDRFVSLLDPAHILLAPHAVPAPTLPLGRC
ncbi:LysR family transcriptional regulator [Kitasatospora phosalacinea]|uniref:LysR family transcriptional regulator n=1 Tax=Kitasatospora phosalacinea TaxID=2065 RepID=A0A9W6QD45_9ACTN|nr:LysR substrate-binding domain-containing protein [Kitasatospora phosalacinea]GLW74245.1 LysR family transcriptional regulator [Kitasatospora phosalacinea]